MIKDYTSYSMYWYWTANKKLSYITTIADLQRARVSLGRLCGDSEGLAEAAKDLGKLFLRWLIADYDSDHDDDRDHDSYDDDDD